jgi:DNA ligase (NAD+)
LDALADAGKQKLQKTAGLGETLASAIAQWFDNEKNQRLVSRLKNRGLETEVQRKGSRLEGKTLVITGQLDAMTRDEAAEAIRMQGGKSASSVSSNTDYLVVGSDPGRTKTSDADKHDVPRIDEEEFLKKIGKK